MIKKADLKDRIQGINKWISENPDVTDPNMYEMIDCMTSVGVVAREENIANKPGKFPEQGSELYEIYKEWYKMHKSRMSKELVNDPKYPANVNTDLYKYYSELNMICCTGELPLPEEESKREEYLECLKKIGSVSLYINQQERDNSNYTYDNYNEAKWITEKSEEFRELLPISSRAVIDQINHEIEKSKDDREDR